MNIAKTLGAVLFAACLSTNSSAELLAGDHDSVTISGFGAFQAGQLERGYYLPSQASYSALVSHRWDESLMSRLCATVQIGSSLKINLGTEYDYDFNVFYPEAGWEFSVPLYNYYGNMIIHRADMEYDMFSSRNTSVMIQLGYFPFKYNPQATNLGEYLFRSEIYPNMIVNEFEFPETRLLGINLEAATRGEISGIGIPFHIRQDIIVTSETTYPPQDLSLAYLSNADFFHDAFELGAGIEAERLLSVDPLRTTPHIASDTISVNQVTGDSSFYTFAGTKIMARTCFDPKKVLPMPFLGKEDLKIYGEYAILGLKDYPRYYNNISERMPVMFGFDIPTFKFLDVLAFEAEYYTSPYFGNNSQTLYDGYDYPVPIPDPNWTDEEYNTDHGLVTTTAHRWKWSLYGSKAFGKNFRIVAQAARDHSRFQTSLYDQPYYLFDGDVTVGAKDWYYLFRAVWSF